MSVSGRWRYKLRGGARVHLTLDGRERVGYAEVIDSPEEVVQIFKLPLDRLGPSGASQLGMKLNVKRLPTADEIRPVVAPSLDRACAADRPTHS